MLYILVLITLVLLPSCASLPSPWQSRLKGATLFIEPDAKIISPVWSPDGSKIAFATTHYETGRGNVYLLNLTTQEASVLIANDYYLPVSWSSIDEIALAGPGGIWTVLLDGSAPTQVAKHGHDAAWAPSGRVLAVFEDSVSSSDSWTESLHLLDLENGTDTVILNTTAKQEGAATDISWSPDGAELAFSLTTGDGDTDTNIYVFDLKSRKMSQLTKDKNYNRQPFWSPNSGILAYLSSPPKKQASHIVFKDLTNACTLETQNIGWADIAWSPNGEKLAFSRDDSLYVAKVQDLLGGKDPVSGLPCR